MTDIKVINPPAMQFFDSAGLDRVAANIDQSMVADASNGVPHCDGGTMSTRFRTDHGSEMRGYLDTAAASMCFYESNERNIDRARRYLDELRDERADLCVVDTRAPHMTPLFKPYSHLAYAAHGSDVLHTVVDGRVVYRDRRHTSLDVESVVGRVPR